MRIGILGGSFNPPHIAHLVIAESARTILRLDKVFFIPCNQAPHKSNEALASPKDRRSMLKLSLSDNPYFEILDNELRRGGVSYTVDTLREIKRTFSRAKLFLIIGADLSRQFSTWKKPASIRSFAKIAVVNRFRQNPRLKGAHFLAAPRMDLSSSMVRARVQNKQSIRYLVPEAVREYIEKKRLYLKASQESKT